MSVIVPPGAFDILAPLRVRKTVAFDGTAGNGAIGTVALFTVTGVVAIKDFSIFCTEACAGATATLAIGTAGNTAIILAATTITTVALNDIVSAAGTTVPGWSGSVLGQFQTGYRICVANIIGTVATANITDGTLVFDLNYIPLSANGSVV